MTFDSIAAGKIGVPQYSLQTEAVKLIIFVINLRWHLNKLANTTFTTVYEQFTSAPVNLPVRFKA